MEENEMGKNEKTEKSQETTSTNQENNIKSNVEKEASKADTEKKEEPKFKKDCCKNNTNLNRHSSGTIFHICNEKLLYNKSNKSKGKCI